MNDPTQPPEAAGVDWRVLLRDMLTLGQHQGFPPAEVMKHIQNEIWNASPHLPASDIVIKPALEKGAEVFANLIMQQ